jgi:serine protease AprX
VTFTIPKSLVKYVSMLPDVKFMSPDRPMKATLEYAAPAVGATIAADYGWTGNGIGVAVIDSGISNTHDDLKDLNKIKTRVVYAESFVPGDSTTQDGYGHGTHVAAIIGGNASKSKKPGSLRKFQGIAPEVNLINLRVLNANGEGSESAVIAAIERAIALKSTYNIRVINLSLGRPVFESYKLDPLCQAVEDAWNAGIVVVTSAGNNGRFNANGNQGYGTISAPWQRSAGHHRWRREG